MKGITVSIATTADSAQLLTLVNNAYRGEEARKGWTHEADLIDGTLRISEAALKELMEKENAIILKCTEENERIIGCVYLEKQEDKLYLGMLSVLPQIQAKGIGKKLLKASEEYAIKEHVHSIVMTVISLRHELIAWYKRNGYKETGETKPFPEDDRFGRPRQEIEFIVMEKQVG